MRFVYENEFQANKGLETLLLAWNGFGFEGSMAMGSALAENTSLLTLDLSNNRIQTRDLFDFIKGLEKNKTLSVLKVSVRTDMMMKQFSLV